MSDEARPDRGARWAQKLADRKERYQERGRLYRVGWVITGVLVTLAGVAMLVTPGPAFVIIPIGLAMLAMEFAWAEAALEKALEKADQAQRKAKQAGPRQKAFTIVAGVLVVAAVVGAILHWDVTVPVINPD